MKIFKEKNNFQKNFEGGFGPHRIPPLGIPMNRIFRLHGCHVIIFKGILAALAIRGHIIQAYKNRNRLTPHCHHVNLDQIYIQGRV